MDYIRNNRVSEANVQAELYSQLKAAGIHCELEYKIYPVNQRGCRFDCVVIVGNRIAVIIEVKNHARPGRTHSRWLNSKQAARYKSFGVPLILCAGFDDIAGVVVEVKSILGKTLC